MSLIYIFRGSLLHQTRRDKRDGGHNVSAYFSILPSFFLSSICRRIFAIATDYFSCRKVCGIPNYQELAPLNNEACSITRCPHRLGFQMLPKIKKLKIIKSPLNLFYIKFLNSYHTFSKTSIDIMEMESACTKQEKKGNPHTKIIYIWLNNKLKTLLLLGIFRWCSILGSTYFLAYYKGVWVSIFLVGLLELQISLFIYLFLYGYLREKRKGKITSYQQKILLHILSNYLAGIFK